jgi:hypothetical protein
MTDINSHTTQAFIQTTANINSHTTTAQKKTTKAVLGVGKKVDKVGEKVGDMGKDFRELKRSLEAFMEEMKEHKKSMHKLLEEFETMEGDREEAMAEIIKFIEEGKKTLPDEIKEYTKGQLYEAGYILEIIEKKGLIAEKCNIELGSDIIPYDGTNDNLYEPDEIRIAYAAPPGVCFGWLVQETVEDQQYIQKASSIMDDLYQSFRGMESYTDDQKLHKLRTLLRYIDSVRGQVKEWPNVPIREELLRHIDEKYETYDELYDEISLRLQLQRK